MGNGQPNQRVNRILFFFLGFFAGVLILVSLFLKFELGMLRYVQPESILSSQERWFRENQFQKISSPDPLPDFVLSALPFARESEDYLLFSSPAGEDFVLEMPRQSGWGKNQLEEEIRNVLAKRNPEKRTFIMPDGTESTELFFAPSRFVKKKLPSFGINFFKEGNEQIAFTVSWNIMIISNSSKLLFKFLLGFQ